ncbi:chymotrypsin-1-like [Spodoptera litura]|uniref:Chymotrypsin-1-like n=1 Tax=Spodoptera litura TaxID=69820 RepID=A0A9J7ISJ9_SPOLT|nr:chymotrypsin-1-like [Spodoptera litura]
MDYKAGLLVFITLLIGSLALPTPEDAFFEVADDVSIFFDQIDVNARIVGGSPAAIGGHPHMVAMTSGAVVRSFHCGASLISQRTVLTAAHCIDAVFREGALLSTFRVNIGSNLWNGGTDYVVARNVTHPNWYRPTIKEDIGVLITAINVALSNLVQPVPLTYDFIGGGVPSIVAGWGRVRAGGAISRQLLELKPTTLDGADCMIHVARAGILLGSSTAPPIDTRFEICAYHSPGLGVCNGDSGSALRRASDGHQIGITSWAFICALGAPDMYVRVSTYQDWLRSVIV